MAQAGTDRPDISLAAALFQVGGLKALKGHPAFDPLIKEAEEAETRARERRERYGHMGRDDVEFVNVVERAILEDEPVKDRFILVAVPTGLYGEWLVGELREAMQWDVIRPYELRRFNTVVRVITEDEVRHGTTRGHLVDRLLMHDHVSWRTYEALMPCLRRH